MGGCAQEKLGTEWNPSLPAEVKDGRVRVSLWESSDGRTRPREVRDGVESVTTGVGWACQPTLKTVTKTGVYGCRWAIVKSFDGKTMLTKRILGGWVCGVLLFTLNGLLAAETNSRPFLHPLFSDHAVLQRGIPVPVWGWTKPGEKVTLTCHGQEAVATAEANGRWQAKLGPFEAGGPYTITVVGPESVTVKDVLIGDVWICSGQSNMEMGIGACNATNDIASAEFPQMRLLTVPRLVATEPVESAPCHWLPCSPKNVMQGLWGGFSAAGFYFGRELQRELKIPIGLIHISWGGTLAEAWTSDEGLQPLPDFAAPLKQFKALAAVAKHGSVDYARQLESWYAANDPGTAGGWQKPETDTADWKTVRMPQPWEEAGLPDYDGVGWFRREFEVPDAWVGMNLVLRLGPIDDMDTTWVNGVKVGQNDAYNIDRVYRVPGGAVRVGRNVIAIRVLDTGGAGGLTGKPEQMGIAPAGDKQASPLPLAGEWQMRASAALSKLPALPPRLDPGNPNVVTVLYNGMLAPLLPFAIKGAIWYQGESNAGRAWQYRRLLPAMIADWRARFGVGDFPFYIVQLAAWQPTFPEPRDNEWAELREAQTLTAKNIPNTGLAVAIDIGDAADIHPKDKRDVGRRLALCALAKTYGRTVEYSGPWYKSMTVIGNTIRLSFDHADGGLVAKGNTLSGFAIAGDDRKFVWGDAVIEGDQVVVSSPKVSNPVAVRYAWDINPVCNLFNRSDLPAVPFRTDEWPLVTQDKK
jgi:sialate O-acetylesterase